MAEHSISVDLFNPGQVFACLGFLEAAEVLFGDAEGGFDWSDEVDMRYSLRTKGEGNPFEAVLAFVLGAEVIWAAHGTAWLSATAGQRRLSKASLYPGSPVRPSCRVCFGVRSGDGRGP